MSSSNPADHPPPRLQRLSRLLAWVFIGGVLGMIVTMVILRVWSSGSGLPTLDREQWEEARERWKAAGIENYQIEIQVTGRQAATYAVHVRDGEVQQATRDGHPLPQKRTWHTWTVEGMFETIAKDLDSVERHAADPTDRSTPQLQLRGTFDAQIGYPATYHRTELVRFGANPEVSWRVIRFDRE